MMEKTRGVSARLGRRAAVASALAVLMGLAAVPAMASPDDSVLAAPTTFVDELQFSSDGANYADVLPDLFTSASKLVPGETVERSFWIRNGHSSAMNVSFAQQSSESGVTIRVHAGADSTVTLAPRGTINVTVEARLPASVENTTQNGLARVQIHFTVSEAVGVGGELGNTGADVGLLPLAAAALAGGAGAYLAARRRTSRAGNRTLEKAQA